MKKSALLAAMAAAMIATPAVAAGGSIGLSYGQTDNDTAEGDTLQIDGAIGGSSDAWGFQVDGALGNTEFDAGGDADHYSLAGHVYWQGSSWRLGGVVGVANIEAGPVEIEDTVYGAEGTLDFGPNAVGFASATLGTMDFIGFDFDTWNVDAGVRFYASPNLRFSGALGVGNVEASGFPDFDTFTAGVNGEWAPFAAPVSFTLGWSHFSDDDSIVGDSDNVSLGVRWNFGGGTLRERDNATPFNTPTGAVYPRSLNY